MILSMIKCQNDTHLVFFNVKYQEKIIVIHIKVP